MADFGSGVALDRNFDFWVDSTGDLGGVSGMDELEKDLVFNLVAAIRHGYGVDTPETMQDGAVGELIDNGTLRDIEIVLSKVASRDPRIQGVVGVSADAAESNSERIVAQLHLETVEDTVQFELVIPL